MKSFFKNRLEKSKKILSENIEKLNNNLFFIKIKLKEKLKRNKSYKISSLIDADIYAQLNVLERERYLYELFNIYFSATKEIEEENNKKVEAGGLFYDEATYLKGRLIIV